MGEPPVTQPNGCLSALATALTLPLIDWTDTTLAYRLGVAVAAYLLAFGVCLLFDRTRPA